MLAHSSDFRVDEESIILDFKLVPNREEFNQKLKAMKTA